jgi:hypothetical protein
VLTADHVGYQMEMSVEYGALRRRDQSRRQAPPRSQTAGSQ